MGNDTILEKNNKNYAIIIKYLISKVGFHEDR